jgi:hypothetical protein
VLKVTDDRKVRERRHGPPDSGRRGGAAEAAELTAEQQSSAARQASLLPLTLLRVPAVRCQCVQWRSGLQSDLRYVERVSAAFMKLMTCRQPEQLQLTDEMADDRRMDKSKRQH